MSTIPTIKEKKPVKPTSPELSFEFFPPKNARMERSLWRIVGQLEVIKPSFFSVTYGALGNDRDRSLTTIENMREECGVPIAAHITSAGHTKESLLNLAEKLHASGIQRLVALRGDAELEKGGITDVAIMVKNLLSVADFDISVAAYPEVHPKAKSLEADLIQLKRKLDAGSQRAITQYFFDADTFLRFRDQAVAIGITQPIVPGILPIKNFTSAVNFSKHCGANIPDHIHQRFAGTQAGSEEQQKLGIDLTVEISNALMKEGVNQLHYYTLNIPSLTFEVLRQLGLTPKPS